MSYENDFCFSNTKKFRLDKTPRDRKIEPMLSKAKSRFIGKLIPSINQQNLECKEIKNSFELESVANMKPRKLNY